MHRFRPDIDTGANPNGTYRCRQCCAYSPNVWMIVESCRSFARDVPCFSRSSLTFAHSGTFKQLHTNGCYDGSLEALTQSVRPLFVELIQLAVCPCAVSAASPNRCKLMRFPTHVLVLTALACCLCCGAGCFGDGSVDCDVLGTGRVDPRSKFATQATGMRCLVNFENSAEHCSMTLPRCLSIHCQRP